MIKKLFSSSGVFWNWLVVSSSNPSQVALTVKGVFSLAVVQGVFALLPSVGIHPSFSLSDVQGGAYSLAYTGLTAVAGVVTFYGVVRKAIVTIHGLVPPPAPKPPVAPAV